MFEDIVKSYPTVIGRERKDLENFGTVCSGYIGKHIVGKGEDAHLTTKVFLDFMKVHVILICGKRGTGKSYSAGTILEEFDNLPEDFKNRMAFLVIDPVGIYWSMKFPNKQQESLLKEWSLEPRGVNGIKILVPFGQLDEYQKVGIPVDGTITLNLKDLSVEEMLLAFGIKRLSEEGVALERAFSKLQSQNKDFDFLDLIEELKKDENARREVKQGLVSLLETANSWGLVSKKGLKVEEIVEAGKITVIDVSRMRSEELRNLLVSLLTREVYRLRLLSRKEEERARVSGEQPKFSFPITWVIFEEAHNFIPADKEVASSAPIKTLARQGREPGVGLIVITQMPSRLHQDVLSQTDIVISFRLTSKDDLSALHAVMQTYMEEEIENYINSLPRFPGAAIILDDNLEKVFTVAIRPRTSWHAGGTAQIL